MSLFKYSIKYIVVSIICLTVYAKDPDNCPTCVMPCRLSGANRPSLTKLFSNSRESYAITTILDGFEGNFKIIITQNTTENLVYSAKISVANWIFEAHCRILNELPEITKVENDDSQLKVQFRSFRYFYVHLLPDEDYLTSMLFEKVGSVQRELTEAKKELRRVEIQPKLKYAISNANITANKIKCKHPNPFVFPTGDRHCSVTTGDWIYFDLKEIFTINLIRFRLWDQDKRVFTYNLAVSLDYVNWVSLAEGRTGQSVQQFKFEEPIKLRFIKMEGYNSKSMKLHLVSMAVDWI